MRLAYTESLMSAGAIVILLLALLAIDDRVREQLTLRLAAAPGAQLSSAAANLRALADVVFEAARDRSVEHAPLLLFGLAAVVLVLFMLRT